MSGWHPEIRRSRIEYDRKGLSRSTNADLTIILQKGSEISSKKEVGVPERLNNLKEARRAQPCHQPQGQRFYF